MIQLLATSAAWKKISLATTFSSLYDTMYNHVFDKCSFGIYCVITKLSVDQLPIWENPCSQNR